MLRLQLSAQHACTNPCICTDTNMHAYSAHTRTRFHKWPPEREVSKALRLALVSDPAAVCAELVRCSTDMGPFWNDYVGQSKLKRLTLLGGIGLRFHQVGTQCCQKGIDTQAYRPQVRTGHLHAACARSARVLVNHKNTHMYP